MSHRKVLLAFCLTVLAVAMAAPSYSAAAPPECIFFGNGNGRYENAACTMTNANQANNGYSLTACILTPPGAIGTFSNATCTTPMIGGAWVESTCVNVRAGNGQYKDPGCTMVEAGGPWELIFRRPRPGLQNNLQWAVDGKILLESSESDTITASGKGNQLFKVTGLLKFTVLCKTAKLLEGAKIVGSASETAAGTSSLKIEYGGCELEGKPECEINGKTGVSKEAKITTKQLTGTLKYTTAAGAEKEFAEISSASTAGLLLKPAEGAIFTEVKLGKGGCPIETTASVEGEVLAKVLGTPEIDATTHELELGESETYWENSAGKTVSGTVKKLKGFGSTIGAIGKLEVNVKSTQVWLLTN
jgi:hypothetical protein